MEYNMNESGNYDLNESLDTILANHHAKCPKQKELLQMEKGITIYLRDKIGL